MLLQSECKRLDQRISAQRFLFSVYHEEEPVVAVARQMEAFDGLFGKVDVAAQLQKVD